MGKALFGSSFLKPKIGLFSSFLSEAMIFIVIKSIMLHLITQMRSTPNTDNTQYYSHQTLIGW